MPHFDIIGDVHGCYAELLELLHALGYTYDGQTLAAPPHRQVVWVGDLTDRGPDSPAVLRLVQQAVAAGVGLCVCGNHDDKLHRYLKGNKVTLSHGLELTAAQLAGESEAFRVQCCHFLGELPDYLSLDSGKLIVAHAGLPEQYHGKQGAFVRSICLYGLTTGERDSDDLPVRKHWARDYAGQATVVYGHTPIVAAEWCNNALNIDTGCVFGGSLTALRYPEMTLVTVPCRAQYAVPRKLMGTLSQQLF